MTEIVDATAVLLPEGEGLDPTDLPAVLAELGESAANLERIGERPPHLPVKVWVKVACVLGIQEWLIRHGTCNIAEACRETGWMRWTYERATRDPAVIDYVTKRTFEVLDLGARTIESRWLDIVNAQVEIATNRELGQAATRAASWLGEQLKVHDERSKAIVHELEQQEGSSRLQRIAERFGAELQERTTVTRSVKLPPGDGG